ncbi:MAG: NAD+ synthase [Deltaproteobacteria bacterium]
MATVRIAQAQIDVTVGDLSGNLHKIGDWIEQARAEHADIVTFPELALCGYPPEDLLFKPQFLTDNRLALEKLAPLCKGITVVLGFADSENGKVFNAAALIHDTELVRVYHKIELPNYGVFDEKRYFQSGRACAVFDMAGNRFSLTICEDIWIPGSITEGCALKNEADAVLNISASPFHAGKLEVRRAIVNRYARASRTTVFHNNLVGGQDELVFDGGSVVVDPHGKLLARARRFEEQLLVTDFEAARAHPEPPAWNLMDDGDAPLVIAPHRTSAQHRRVPCMAPELDRIEEIYQGLILGTRDYVLKNGFQKVVMGLSGGIDSSLTAAVAVQALSAGNVIGVTMPSQYTSDETLSDAEVLARSLEIELITVPIRGIFQAYLDVLERPLGSGDPGIELENLQARIRANILMTLSNKFGWLVLTTSNKSETAVGYTTLYGDMAGGFAVIKDVPKTVVYELSEYVNREAGTDTIPRSVIRRPPTAELKHDQKDEDSLPPYALLDPILKAYVEEDKSPERITAEGFESHMVSRVVRMVDRNEYKRRQAAPGVKITPKAFGKDRRVPITNRYLSDLSFDGD